MPGDIAALIPPGAALIEFGSGSSTKTRIMLSAAKSLGGLCAGRHLGAVPARSRRRGCARNIPRCRCFRSPPTSPSRSNCPTPAAGMPRVGLFSGLDHRQFRAARGGGVPAPRRPHSRPRRDVHRRRRSGQGHAGAADAYNDSQGVTAQFNLNLLARINRELGAKFNLGLLRASRLLQPRASRIEMHLASLKRQRIKVRRRVHRIPRRRNHPHREQLQVFGRVVRRAGARRRLDADGGLDRSGQLLQRPRADACAGAGRLLVAWNVVAFPDLASAPPRRGEALALPEARRLASRIVATSIAPTSGRNASSSAASLARRGEISSTAS